MQIDLFGGATPLQKPALKSDRQRAVLLELRKLGRLDQDEAGAIAHELKEGRWAHGRDTRCDFCSRDGRQILERLVGLGLARRRRPANRIEYHAHIPDPDPLADDPDFAAIPDLRTMDHGSQNEPDASGDVWKGF